jgi:hypothetical protein
MKIKCKIIIILLVMITITSKADTLDVPLQFSSIQIALDSSDSNDVIFVQPGIYYENLIWPSISGIHLLSAGDTSNTFIDGGNFGRVITMNDYSGLIDTSTIINGFTIQNGFVPDSLNFRGAGLYIYNCSPKLVNLRIRNNKSQSWTSYGVGVYICKSNSILEEVTISHCEVVNSNRVYGVGLYCDSSHIAINKLTISDLILNSEIGCYGAGIYARNSYINLSSFFFENNHLNIKYCNGGAINANFDTIILHDFQISNNSFNSLYYHGSILGGGIHLDKTIGEITNGSIINNYSNASGTYGYCNGGGIYIDDFSDITVTNVMIKENTLDSYNNSYGGGAYISGSSVVNIDSSSFSNNTLYSKSWTYGGGIYISDNSEVKINHSNISGNFFADTTSKWMYGGGIFIVNNSSIIILNSFINDNFSANGALWYHGGGIFGGSSQIILINSVVSNNIFGLEGNWYYGGGIYACQESDIIVTNSTIAGNRKPDSTSIKGSGICVNSSSLNMTNSICRNENSSTNNEIWTCGIPIGTRSVAYSNTRGICPGPGNIDSDPLFISDNDFHLQVLSPCINTGNTDTTGLNIPLVDIEGNPRINEEIIDMGAYENQEQSVWINFLEENEVVIFPNPTNGIFYITGSNLLNVQVLNEFGQVIIEKSKNSKIDLGYYANGIYFIKITTDKKIITRKLIKQ